ncbi:hypothetical protein D3C84_425940 [compost metagenome]
MQAVSALLGVLQGLLTNRAIGHSRHLQVGLDGGQRRAQLMGGVIGQAPFAFDRLGNAQEQLVLGIQQRLQLAGQGAHLQRFKGIRATPAQGITHAVERCQALADTDPEQPKGTKQGDKHRRRSRQQDRAIQRLTLLVTVGRGDADITAVIGKRAPARALDGLVAKTTAIVVEGVSLTMVAGNDLAT